MERNHIVNRLTATVMALYLSLSTLSSPASLPTRLRRRSPDEHGSVTIDNVMWAVAVIGFVAIVTAAIRAYVVAQAGNIVQP
jgi:hypothetical protein